MVVPGREDEEPTYTDLYAVERFPAGTVLELVDRLSGCPEAETTRIFVRVIATPGD